MNKEVFKLTTRECIAVSFASYQPIRTEGSGPVIKGSRCLVSPYAFQHKKIVNYVTKHPLNAWLLYAYTERQSSYGFRELSLHVYSKISPTLDKLKKERITQISLLVIPALIEAKHLYLTGKKKFTVNQLCNALGIDEKNNHWHRDLKRHYVAILEIIDNLDTKALIDVDSFIHHEGLYKWPLLEDLQANG